MVRYILSISSRDKRGCSRRSLLSRGLRRSRDRAGFGADVRAGSCEAGAIAGAEAAAGAGALGGAGVLTAGAAFASTGLASDLGTSFRTLVLLMIIARRSRRSGEIL